MENNFSSEVIEWFDYHEGSCILIICFKNGAIYDYFGVPVSVYNNFVNAPLKGEFFNRHIKGAYPTSKE